MNEYLKADINKTNNRIALTVVFFAISLNIFAQYSNKTDSLIKKLETAVSDSERADIYTRLCWGHRYDTSLIALDYGKKALQIYTKQNNIRSQCQILNFMGVAKRCNGHFFSALEHFYKVLSIAQKPLCNMEIAYAYNNIGDAYFRLGKYNNALEYVDKSFLINQSINNEEGIAYNLMVKSQIYKEQKNWSQAIMHYKQALDIRLKLGLFGQVSLVYSSIGDCFMEWNLSDSAFVYYNKAKDLGLFESYVYYLVLGKYYYSKKQYGLAISNLKKCIAITPPKEQQDLLAAYRILHKIYFDLHEYRTAYIMQAKAAEINDSLQSTNNIKKLTQLEMNYEFEQKNKIKEIEAENLKKQYESKIEKQRIISYGLIILLLAATTTVFFIFKYVIYIKKTNQVLKEMNDEITENHIAIQCQNIELHKLNSTKDKFFSIIAHDLRGPISSFKNLIEFMINEIDLTDTQQVYEILHTINKSSNSTYDLLENLLIWAKSQRNEIVLMAEHLNLYEILEMSISVLKDIANQKRITIHNLIPENQIIYADLNMLMTIFRNLISNAVKFSNPGGNIYLSLYINNRFCTLSVKDEGIGINSENLNKIFNIEEHFTTYGTAKEKGSGLGLMLCKELIEKHGGTIWVESVLDKGSDFKLNMPLKD